MSFFDSLKSAMPTFFKSAGDGALPMPKGGGGGNFWWGDGTGPIYGPAMGLNVSRSINFAQAAGDVTQNSAVAACLNWMATSWGDAPAKTGVEVNNKFEPDDGSALSALLAQPNPDYAGIWLTWALLSDYWRFGRAYCYIVVGIGAPAELQYLPARCVTAVPDSTGRLLRYDYKPERQAIALDPARVVHFRFGINPDNPLEGVPPLAPVYDEIVSDNACARYPANMMHHGGLPPALLVPEPASKDTVAEKLTPDMAKALKDAFNEKRRASPGDIQMLSNAMKLLTLGFKPSEMALNELREEPETRICAVIGIPPIVANLRAGLLRSTYNNTTEANKAAWTQCLIPLQRYFASEWTRKLLPFYPTLRGSVVAYDHSQVAALQDNQLEKRKQALSEYNAGMLTLEEARAEGGRDSQVPKDGFKPAPAPSTTPPPVIDPGAQKTWSERVRDEIEALGDDETQ